MSYREPHGLVPVGARRPPVIVYIAALMVALALIFIAESYFNQIANERAEPFWLLARRQSAIFIVRAALAPLVVLVCAFARDGLRSLGARLALHTVAALAFATVSALVIPVIQTVLQRLPEARTFIDLVRLALLSTTFGSVLTYILIALTWYAVTYYYDAHDRTAHAAKLQAELSQARLRAMQGQMQPYFLFNTLNAVSTLASDDVRGARVMLGRLADLLRASLDRVESPEIPLSDELALVRQYLAIQEVRFGNRLRVRLDTDAAPPHALVPCFLLQPLVENAIRHGVEIHDIVGEIVVTANVEGSRLHIVVQDHGPGLVGGAAGRASGAIAHGIGLGNTSARLRELYGDDHAFTIANGQHGGLVVSIAIPLHH
jgi:two-component system, LytTR family, sensor kinase